MSEALINTPFHELQARIGARFVPFGGWNLPVSYSGSLQEYWAVRREAGLFDVSHMGRLIFSGAESGDFLDTLLTNDIARLKVGRG